MKKKKIDKEVMLLEAKERLVKKGLRNEVKKDLNHLLTYVRPEHMKNKNFNHQCEIIINKYLDLSKKDIYDEYEKEVIKNTSGSFYEFQLKAYLTVAYY